MERHFAKIFWGTSGNKNNYHWSSWKNLCYPKDEGGIGIKSMQDSNDTMSIKRWWRCRTQPSLWASHLRGKYYSRKHHIARKEINGTSLIWRNMLQFRDKDEKNIIWKIQAGNYSFWWDNWTRKGALAALSPTSNKPSKTLVSYFILEKI